MWVRTLAVSVTVLFFAICAFFLRELTGSPLTLGLYIALCGAIVSSVWHEFTP